MANSFRGGTGKSTIISNLASYLASVGMKTVVVDADVISPGVHAIFGLDSTSMSTTLTDYLNGDARISEAVYDVSTNLSLTENSLLLVPGSITSTTIAELVSQKKTAERLVKGIPQLIKEFKPDVIMIDTHPGLNDEFLVMSDVAHVLLNIVRPDNQDYQGLRVSAGVAKKLGMKNYVVLNKIHHQIKQPKLRQTIASTYNLPIAGALPLSDDIILSQSQYVFSEKYPEHDFSKGIYEIAANVFGIKHKNHLETMHDLLADINSGKVDQKKLWSHEHMTQAAFKEYVDELQREKFVKKEKGLYVLTDKGKKFLKKYRAISKFVDNFRL